VYPERPLYPRSAFGIAKLNELTQIIDLYLELTARRLLPNYFSRKPAPENIANDVRATLAKGAKAVAALARFEGYILGGDSFSAADAAATIHFPLVRAISKSVLSEDPLANVPGLTDYLARMEQRETMLRIRKDQREDMPKFMEHLKQRASS
ncbi:MAG TPA: hypothetical protein VMF89_16475, partial [Polyangiales bacterium]|nr:hypothetical protein [Polyangiales bacterium]